MNIINKQYYANNKTITAHGYMLGVAYFNRVYIWRSYKC